uniref:MI domain-containing protein n=1 Tax=Strongyloides papillosus TaxID=174720 RepID=A0A0N5C834_STREA
MHTNKNQSRAHQPQVPLTLTQNVGEGNRHNSMPINHPQNTPLLAMPIPTKVPPPYTQNFSTPPPSIPGNNGVGNSVNSTRNIHSLNNTNITHGMGPSMPQGNHPYIYPHGIHGQQGQTPHPQPVSGNIYQQNPPPTQGIMTMPGFVNSPQGGPPFIGGPIPQGIQIPPGMVGYYSPMIQSSMNGPVPGDGYNYNQQHHVLPPPPPPQMVSVVPGSSNQQPNIPGGLPSSSQGVFHQRNNGNNFRNNQKGPQMPPMYGPLGNFYSMPMNMMMTNNSIPPHVMPTQINQPPVVQEVKEKTKIFVQKNKDGVYLYGHMTSTGLVFSKEPPKEMVQDNEPPEQEIIDNYQCNIQSGMEPSTSGGIAQGNPYGSCPSGSVEDYAYSETDSVNVPSDPRQISHTPVENVEDNGENINENCINPTEGSISSSLSNMLKQSGMEGMNWSDIVEEEKKNEVNESNIYKEDESCSSQETTTGNEYVISVFGDDPKKIKKLTKGLLDEIFAKYKIKHDGIKTTSGEIITSEKQCESSYLVYFKNKNSMIKALKLNDCVENYIKLFIKLKSTSQQNISNDNIVKEQIEGYKAQISDNRSGGYQDVRLSREYHGNNRYGNYRNNDNNYQRKQGSHYYESHSKGGNYNKDNNFRGIQQKSNHGSYYNKNNYNQRHNMPSSGGTYSGDKSNNPQFEYYNNHRNNFIKQNHSGPVKSDTASNASHYGSNSSLLGNSRISNLQEKDKSSSVSAEDTVLDTWCKERKEKSAAVEASNNKCNNDQNNKARLPDEKIAQPKTSECLIEKEVLEEKILEDKKNIYQKDNSRRNYHLIKGGNNTHYNKKDSYHKYSGSQSARLQNSNVQKQIQQNSTSNNQDGTLPPTGNNCNSNSQGVKNNFKSNTLPRRISQHNDSNTEIKKRENSINVRTFINSNTKGSYNKCQSKKHEFTKNQSKRNNSQSSSIRSVRETKVENKSTEDLKCIATEVSQPLSAASSPPSLTEMILPLNEKKSQDDMGSALSVSSIKSFKSTSSRPPRIQTNIKYNEAISPQMVSPADSNIDDYFSASENADEFRNKIEIEKSNSTNNIVKENTVAKPSPTKKNRNAKKKEKKNDKNCPTEALLSKNRFAVLTKD